MASSDNQIRVVLVGKTGSGKSSLGNALLHSCTAFHSKQSSQSITQSCECFTRDFTDAHGSRKNLMVVDTPGFFDTDTSRTNDYVEQQIASKIFQMTAPGVHAFLIVLAIGRFTPEQQETVNIIKKIFGNEAEKYCIVVFTREDDLDEGQTLADFVNSSPPSLKALVQRCGNPTFTINNKLRGELLIRKTDQLVQMIGDTVRNNGGRYYTNQKYQDIVRKRQEEKQKQEEEQKRRKKAEEDAIIARVRAEEKKEQEKTRRELEEKVRQAEKRAEEARRPSASYYGPSHETCSSGNGILAMLRDLNMGDSGGSISSGSYNQQPMSFQRMPSASSSYGGSHGSRFTGEFMSTSGSANGRPIYEGSRGGNYYMTSGGNKRYI